jgi:hypothetical protein
MIDIYGKSPIMEALSQVRLMNKSASLIYINPQAYRDINKMKRSFKHKKSDIGWIKSLKCFPIPKISFISPSLHMADINFIEMSRAMEQDIYKALQVPKEYLRPIKGIHITNGHKPFITNTPTI